MIKGTNTIVEKNDTELFSTRPIQVMLLNIKTWKDKCRHLE